MNPVLSPIQTTQQHQSTPELCCKKIGDLEMMEKTAGAAGAGEGSKDLPEDLKIEIESHVMKLLHLTVAKTTHAVIPWELLWNKENILASKYYDLSENLICVRGETTLPYTIQEIFQLLTRGDCRRDLDTLIDQTQRLKWFSCQTGVERLVYKPVWPTDPRDFCNVTHWRLLDDGTLLLVAFSLPMDDLCPPQPKFVRGNLRLGGYALRHVPGGTKLYLVVQCDLAGRIPTPVAEYVAKTQPLALISLKKLLNHRYANTIRPNLSNLPLPTFEELLGIARSNQMTTQPVVKTLHANEEDRNDLTLLNLRDDFVFAESNELPNSENSSGDILLKSGFLLKERETLKGWRPRYFTLNQDFLHYFLNKDDISPRNSLQIDASVIVTLESSDIVTTDSSGNTLFPFVIKHPSSSILFRLASRTLIEATLWVKSIQTVIEKHRNQEPQAENSECQHTAADDERHLTPLGNLSSSHQKDLEIAIESLLNFTVNSKHQWNPLYHTDGITAVRTSDVDGVSVIRGESTLNYTIPEIFGVVSRAANRKPLDPMIESYERKKWANVFTGIEYVKYFAKWPTSSRDFCNMTHWRLLPNNIFIMVALSVTDSSCPLRDREDIVRGKLYVGGYVMQQVEGGTNVSIIVKSNLGGSIPKSIVEFASRKQPMAIAAVREFLDKKYAQNKNRVRKTDDSEQLFREVYAIAEENIGNYVFINQKSSQQALNSSTDKASEEISSEAPANDASPTSSSNFFTPLSIDLNTLYFLPFVLLLLKLSPLLLGALLLIEYFLGLFLQRVIPRSLGEDHYSFRLDLKLNEIKQSELDITSTDLLIKVLAQTLQEFPSLRGYFFHGLFFPAQIRNSFRMSVKLHSQHIIPIDNPQLMSLDEIHVVASEAFNNEEKKKEMTSKTIPSFLFYLIQTHLVSYFQQFFLGFAMVAPFPPHLSSQFGELNFSTYQKMSGSMVPIFVTLPHVDLLHGKVKENGSSDLPIFVTIHDANSLADAVEFAHLLKSNLLLSARPPPSGGLS